MAVVAETPGLQSAEDHMTTFCVDGCMWVAHVLPEVGGTQRIGEELSTATESLS